jgi:predicted GIY-YIG superfamily endonuclease
MATTTIYVIILKGGRYYVGKTNDILKRYQEHLSGVGSSWTKKYPPVSLEKIIKNVSPFEEDKVTKEYMSKYGLEKVRGGSYVELELDDFQRETLNREIWGAKDLCKQCGRTGHFAKSCYAKTDISGKQIMYKEDYKDSKDEIELEEIEIDGKDFLWDQTTGDCYTCRNGKLGKVVGTFDGRTFKRISTRENVCYRCGRSGHYSPDCYASRHFKGYKLN